jgi:iron complex transport system permease protein
MITLATFISASTVAIAGTIDWVGLVIPHIIRFMIGPDNRLLLPASALTGGAYMLFTDTLVRSVFSAEIPIGIATSLMLLPLFAFSLYKHRGIMR